MITDLEKTYVVPSQEALEALIEMGYKPVKKNILKKALEKGYMLCVINDVIYYREETELEGFQKIELINEDDMTQNDYKRMLDAMINHANHDCYYEHNIENSEDTGWETEEVEEPIEEVELVSININDKTLYFETPGIYTELLEVRPDPETNDDVIIGFVIENNHIVSKTWTTLGQNLNGDCHLTPFEMPWYLEPSNFPAVIEIRGNYAKAVKYENGVIYCQCCNEILNLNPSELTFIKTVD